MSSPGIITICCNVNSMIAIWADLTQFWINLLALVILLMIIQILVKYALVTPLTLSVVLSSFALCYKVII